LGYKKIKFFDAGLDPGSGISFTIEPLSGIGKLRARILYNHPGSATLNSRNANNSRDTIVSRDAIMSRDSSCVDMPATAGMPATGMSATAGMPITAGKPLQQQQ
jgi:hypothetical protein